MIARLTLIFSLAFLLWSAETTHAQGSLFATRVDYAVGEEPNSLTANDLTATGI